MDREKMVTAIRNKVQNPNLVKHMLATEAIMRVVASRLGEDEVEWGMAGLLHDIDVELTQDNPGSHSKLGAEIAKELGASEAIASAILRHNEAHGLPLETRLDKALFCADPLTGLITATALVRPDKKLEGVTVSSLLKRFAEKRFAAGARREQIARCHELGIGLEDFLALGLEAMQGIASELGL